LARLITSKHGRYVGPGRRSLALVLSLSFAFCAAGCARESDVAKSPKERETSPQVRVQDISRAVLDNNTFALDLYRRLAGRSGNLVVSPYSLSIALAITYAGARGQTKQEIATALHFTFAKDELHRTLNALDLDLTNRAQNAEQFQLLCANSLWAQRGYPFQSTFLDTLAQYYGEEVRLTDFAAKPQAAKTAVNAWARDKTLGKVPDILGSDELDARTRMLLANAIHFKGKWKYPFPKALTTKETFTLLNNTKVPVPMMAANLMGSKHYDLYKYTEGSCYQALELPYRGDQFAILILLPEQGYFQSVQAMLVGDLVTGIAKAMTLRKVEIHLPKFRFTTRLSVKPALQAMGIRTIFASGDADFTEIEPKRELFIRDVVHAATVSVDEEGTEAAAASAVSLTMCAGPSVVRFSADRPFLFVIRDTKTGALLLIGRVLDPRDRCPEQ